MLQIPAHYVASIAFSPLDHEGNPAELDGELSFSLSSGSELFAAILPQVLPNVLVLQCNEPGVATVVASGDVVLGGAVELRTWECEVTIYELVSQLDCTVTSLEPVVDEP